MQGPLTARVLSRTRLAIIVVLAFALAAIVIGRTSTGAGADTTVNLVDLACRTPGLSWSATIPIEISDSPDTADPGGQVVVDISTPLPMVPASVTVNDATFVLPIPDQVTVDAVDLIGGNIPAVASIDATAVSLVLTGPMQSELLRVPTLRLTATVHTGADGSNIAWVPFSWIASDMTLGGAELHSTCVPLRPGRALNCTPVSTDIPTTTVPCPAPDEPCPPDPTFPEPSTTWGGPTTTWIGTTTTTAFPTTTFAPTTTTGAPTTTSVTGSETTVPGPTTSLPEPTTTVPCSPATTTTSTGPTSTSSTPPSTGDTTTTTALPTTTAAPTTTFRPPTTTAAPTTTASGPTTTTTTRPADPPLVRIIKIILRWLHALFGHGRR